MPGTVLGRAQVDGEDQLQHLLWRRAQGDGGGGGGVTRATSAPGEPLWAREYHLLTFLVPLPGRGRVGSVNNAREKDTEEAFNCQRETRRSVTQYLGDPGGGVQAAIQGSPEQRLRSARPQPHSDEPQLALRGCCAGPGRRGEGLLSPYPDRRGAPGAGRCLRAAPGQKGCEPES